MAESRTCNDDQIRNIYVSGKKDQKCSMGLDIKSAVDVISFFCFNNCSTSSNVSNRLVVKSPTHLWSSVNIRSIHLEKVFRIFKMCIKMANFTYSSSATISLLFETFALPVTVTCGPNLHLQLTLFQ